MDDLGVGEERAEGAEVVDRVAQEMPAMSGSSYGKEPSAGRHRALHCRGRDANGECHVSFAPSTFLSPPARGEAS